MRDRARQLNEMVAQHRSELKGRSFYAGSQNLAHRVPRSRHQYPGEFRTL
jgi:hypothetical protein